MKKSFFITLSLLVLSVGSLFAGPSITIQFGHPPECTPGFAICKVTISAMSAHNMELSANGLTLTIHIDASALKHDQPKVLPYLDGKKSVTFEDTWEATPELVKALHSTHPVVIKRGSYPVTFAKGVYTITANVASDKKK